MKAPVLMEEHSPEYDLQANRSAEVGVKFLKGQFRTLRSNLESEIKFRVPVGHPLVARMVRHAAATITWCAKGHDGRSAYERVRSRLFKTRLTAFGESCRFKIGSQEPVSNTSDGRRLHLSVFVGIDRRIGQYMIW